MKLYTNVTGPVFKFRRNNLKILSPDVNILSETQGIPQREVAIPKEKKS